MSRDDVRRYVIAYDIPDDKRRSRLAKTLLRHGDRLQFSVFVVDASPARLIRLETAIHAVIDLAEDSVLFCDLGRLNAITQQGFRYLGQTRAITDTDTFII